MDNLQAIEHSDALLKLHDIRMPNSIDWWPLAPGWYFLLGSLAVIVITLTVLGLRNYSYWRLKKQAISLLIKYKKEYLLHKNTQKSCALVNELLKKVAIAYYSREFVAGLRGQNWLNFLNKTYIPNRHKNLVFNELHKELLEYPYQIGKKENLDLLFSSANTWIKKQRKLSAKRRESLCLN